VYGRDAFDASERSFAEALSVHAYGRDMARLDAQLVGGDRGAVILRAEAGMGKSVVLSGWAGYRASLPEGLPATTVLRHAFSVRERASSSREGMIASLVRQAAIALGPDQLGGGDARDPGHLTFLLSSDQPIGTQLIVALDGLDEAAEVIDPLPLGRGVHVVATCRAEPGETPVVIQKWRDHYGTSGDLYWEIALEPLDAAAVARWLSDATGRGYGPADLLAQRALRASEGIPLFAHYLIPDAIEALRENQQDPFPASFAAYVQKQMDSLCDVVRNERGWGWTWDAIIDLFVILAVCRAPLPVGWVQAWIKRRNPASESRLDVLDERASRWLWRRTTELSFAHPRLAVVFRALLRNVYFAGLRGAEEDLALACGAAWKEAGNLLQRYAVEWLPNHLVKLGMDDAAADVLGNGAFHLQRLVASETHAMVRKTAAETISLSARSDRADLAAWRRFWAETEVRLLKVVGAPVSDIFLQMACDRFGEAMPADPGWPCSRPRLAQPIGFSRPLLEREALHRGVRGVLRLSDRLLSWGFDGAVLEPAGRDAARPCRDGAPNGRAGRAGAAGPAGELGRGQSAAVLEPAGRSAVGRR
jgi:hypothetical protein